MILSHRLRMFAIFVLLSAALAVGAEAETDSAALIFNPTADTLPLYEDPSFSRLPVAWYYNATFVTITEESGAFAAVTIGGPDGGAAVGYMESEHLIHNAAMLSVRSVGPVLSIQNGAGTGLNLRMNPGADPAQLPIMLCLNGTDVMVLGVWDGWLHVRVMDGGITGFVQMSGISAAQTEATAAAYDRLHAHRTLEDMHGYTVNASVTEAEAGEYTIAVHLSPNGATPGGAPVAYHAYADGAYLCATDAAGWAGNSPEGTPIYFCATVAASETVAQIELRPVWRRSGDSPDGVEDTQAENYIVFSRGK